MRPKRELIEPHKGDKRYLRRDKLGRFGDTDDVSRSLSQDVTRKARPLCQAVPWTMGRRREGPESREQ
jgi:hypothetical protein